MEPTRLEAYEIDALRKNLGNLVVSKIMHKNPKTIKTGDGVALANEIMFENNIRHLPVVNANQELEGILSDRDLLSIAMESQSWESMDSVIEFWRSKSVVSVMTKSPETVSADTSLTKVAQIMLEKQISCLPVVEGKRLVGLVTDTDFLKLFSI
ncbi:CBS domain-containing protein [Bdellovibrio sp. NC01]|uniref:CBS domain-containing protein n=1 Tax=Bdellovibrio sp. NC01 TaxID=2220073 RepID=UPI001156D15A|nr:CBS domain-containing protein [Bdellovibrio sp. NC01]QDK36464.1 hypothetical protein DOE51_02040 [Bdellovibrio sp. NC01]